MFFFSLPFYLHREFISLIIIKLSLFINPFQENDIINYRKDVLL
nr:MAG TPA: hypothetical protein [Herelleviridae sp.]